MKESGAKIAERLLTRPSGATMDELIAATGGPQYNVLRRLEARGYKVRKVREGRGTRYFVTAPARPSYDLTVSPKGQVVLPKDLRERLGVARGGTLRCSLQEDGRVFVDAPRYSLRDLVGVLHRSGVRAHTVEEMSDGIARAVGDSYLRSVGRRR
jgi:AbrB family looped-hinge helix DNA binding protein